MARKDTRPFWTLDAETDPFKRWRTADQQRVPKPFIWGLFTGAAFLTFETVEEVVDCIKDQDVIVGAHNGGKFDFHLGDRTARILDHINRYEDMKIINGRLASAKVGACEIRDTWCLFPSPLREFGNKLEIDYRKLEEDVRHKHMPEIRKYLCQDVVGLKVAVDRFEASYGRHLTQAGAAMHQWEAISGEKAPQTDLAFFTRFSAWYYGGHVQCFRGGYSDVPLHVADIRSAYPRAMLEDHPYAPFYVELDGDYALIGSDLVTLSCRSAGALPFRDTHGKITFPSDHELRTFRVTGWEVIAAKETGAISDVEIRKIIRFGSLRNFSAYIQHFYRLRKQYRQAGDEANTYFAKILMNSLYGKFGANPENYGNFMCVDWDEKMMFAKGAENYDGKRDYRFNGKFGPHAVVRADLNTWQQHFINVATAASITGWVRAFLWKAMSGCKGLAYVDTDCVMAEQLPPDMDFGEELGQWQLEGTARESWFAGPKNYYLKGDFGKKSEKMACKGVKPDPRKIKAAAMGRVVTARSAAPTFTMQADKPVYFQQRRLRSTFKPA